MRSCAVTAGRSAPAPVRPTAQALGQAASLFLQSACLSPAAPGGEDARIAIWNPGERMPRMVLEGHRAPVVALAVSGDGRFLASASWDHTARLWPVGGGPPRLLAGHSQNVNGIAFTPDGRAVVTAGYDATLRIWLLSGDDTPLIAVLPTPLNAVAIAPDGEIVTAGADGKIYVLSATGDRPTNLAAELPPPLANALSGHRLPIVAPVWCRKL